MGGHFVRIERLGAGAGRDRDEQPSAVRGWLDGDYLEIAEHGVGKFAGEGEGEFSFHLLAEL